LLSIGCEAALLLPACQTFLPAYSNNSNSRRPFLKLVLSALKALKSLKCIVTPILPERYLPRGYHPLPSALQTFLKGVDNMKLLLSNMPDSFPFLNILSNTNRFKKQHRQLAAISKLRLAAMLLKPT